VPYNHAYVLVSIYSSYLSHVHVIGNGTSTTVQIQVDYIHVIISQNVEPAWGYTDTAIINTTVKISGIISLENGTVLTGVSVKIYWNNGTDVLISTETTNFTGGYSFIYTVPYYHDFTTIYIFTNYSSSNRIIGNGTSSSKALTIDNLHTQIDWNINTLITSNIAPITSYVNISGTLSLTNGTILSNKPIQICWNNGTEVVIQTIYTESDGSFSYDYKIPYDHTFSNVQVYVRFVSYDRLYANVSSSSSTVFVRNYQTQVTLSISESTAYPSDSIYFTGRLLLSYNSSPLSNMLVRIYAGDTSSPHLLASGYTNSTGYYTISFTIPTSVTRGDYNIWANFTSSDRLYNATLSSLNVLTIRKQATLTLTIKDTALRNSVFYIAGQILDSNGNPEAYAHVELSIQPMGWTGSATTDSTGSFNISLNIPDTASGLQTVEGYVPPSTYLDVSNVTKTFQIVIATTLNVEIDSSHSYYSQENLQISGVLRDEDGNSIASKQIYVYIGSSISVTANTNSSGGFNFDISLSSITENGIYTITVSFAGDTNYIEANYTVQIHIFIAAQISMESVPNSNLQTGEPVVFMGRLLDTSSNPIVNREVSFYVNNSLIHSVYTNSSGYFTFSYTVPTTLESGHVLVDIRSVANTQYEATFNIVSNNNNNNTTPGGGSILQISNLLPYIGLGAFIVVLLIYYFMVYRTAKPKEVVLDIPAKLRNIKRLADAGQYSEAISLAYQTFELMAERTTGIKRASHQTAREYLETVLKELPISKDMIMPFLSYYEEARFSNHTITKEHYDNAIRLFTEIYPRISGGTA